MISIRILKKSDNRSFFSSGEIELDYYFQKFAGQNQFKHFVGSTYIATDDVNIFGFVTVSAGSLMRDDLPLLIQKKFPLYPLPILHITRIGVDMKLGCRKTSILTPNIFPTFQKKHNTNK
jgi:hypothetical protein